MSGEVKSLLKTAREAVGAGRNAEAEAACERALQLDPRCYMAHVLLGVALKQQPQAVKAFRTAIDIDPHKPLAWQGLATYLEKLNTEEAGAELVSVYEDMLRLELEPAKVAELLDKLEALARASHAPRVLPALARLSQSSADPSGARTRLLSLLSSSVALRCPPQDTATLIENFIKHAPNDHNLQLNYAKLIALSFDLQCIINKILPMEDFTNNKPLKEWLCARLFEEYVERGSLADIDLPRISEALSENVDEKASAMLQCLMLVNEGLHREAYQLCFDTLNTGILDEHVVCFLVRSSVALYDWVTAVRLIESVQKVKNERISREFKRLLLLCEVRLERWERGRVAGSALQVAVSELSLEEANLFATCLVHLRVPLHEDLLQHIRGTEYHDSLIALQHLESGEPEKAKQILESSTAEVPERWLYLGMALQRLGRSSECLLPLLKATKLDPGRSDCFLHLGQYYEETSGDDEKAKKCYLKAFSLNGYSGDAARALCAVHLRLGDLEAASAVLRLAASSAHGAHAWAQRQLGLHDLAARRWDDAVRSLRAEVRSKPRDRITWAALGDAYFGRRSFVSALKCYERAVECSSNGASYERTQVANIKHAMGLEDEAVCEYEAVLAADRDYRPALEGLSETLQAMAKELLAQQMYGVSRERAQAAVEYCVRSIAVAPDFSRPWKSLGDALLLLTQYPPDYSYAHVPAALFGREGGDSVYKSQLDIFPIAIGCYSRAAKVTPCDPTPFHRDVAAACLAYAEASHDCAHRRRALAVARNCVRVAPTEWEYWNLLGVIAAGEGIADKAFAQYCFLMALSCDKSRPEAWTNLGLLYLGSGEYRTANKSFQRAQEDDPDYVCSWIGQALIAEAVKPSEAMDLFRHAAQLIYHDQAAIGYADWVCTTLRNADSDSAHYKYAIDHVHAVPVALDLMTRACSYRPRDACRLTLLGLLQESSGLLRAALRSHETAMRTSETRDDRDAAALNLGRTRLRAGDATDALSVLQDVAEATFASASCTALALYRARNLEDAYDAFDAVLQWLARTEAEKSDALVAMAAVALELKGAEEAKTILFRSIKASSVPTADSLLATCALGLLNEDAALARLALDELRRHKHNSSRPLDMAVCAACLAECEGERATALETLGAVAERDGGFEAWDLASRLCLRAPRDAERARACAERALKCGGWRDVNVLSATSALRSECGARDEACVLAQRAVRQEPEAGRARAALVRSGLGVHAPRWVAALVSQARRMPLSDSLALWFDKAENVVQTCVT